MCSEKLQKKKKMHNAPFAIKENDALKTEVGDTSRGWRSVFNPTFPFGRFLYLGEDTFRRPCRRLRRLVSFRKKNKTNWRKTLKLEVFFVFFKVLRIKKDILGLGGFAKLARAMSGWGEGVVIYKGEGEGMIYRVVRIISLLVFYDAKLNYLLLVLFSVLVFFFYKRGEGEWASILF